MTKYWDSRTTFFKIRLSINCSETVTEFAHLTVRVCVFLLERLESFVPFFEPSFQFGQISYFCRLGPRGQLWHLGPGLGVWKGVLGEGGDHSNKVV